MHTNALIKIQLPLWHGHSMRSGTVDCQRLCPPYEQGHYSTSGSKCFSLEQLIVQALRASRVNPESSPLWETPPGDHHKRDALTKLLRVSHQTDLSFPPREETGPGKKRDQWTPHGTRNSQADDRANRKLLADMNRNLAEEYESAVNTIQVAQLLLETRGFRTCRKAKDVEEAPAEGGDGGYGGDGAHRGRKALSKKECEAFKREWIWERRQEWTLTLRNMGNLTDIKNTDIRRFLKKRQAEVEHIRRANRAHKDENKVYIAFK